MSTQCRIAVKQNDGSFRAVICNYDGYPSHISKILLNQYNTEESRAKLISNHIEQFDHNDEPIFIVDNSTAFEYEPVEIHDDWVSVLESEGLLGVAHTYIFDEIWYGHYPYLEMGPVPLVNYHDYLIEFAEEDCTW